jgi:hypothetical protein
MSFISEISPTWEASNPSVVMTPDGLQFGPYAQGGSDGGSIRYHGLDGQPLSAVRNLAYNMRFLTDKKVGSGVEPYLRVFTTDDTDTAHDVIYTPGSQPYPGLGAGPFQEFVATAGFWRYDADDSSGGVPLSELQASYGDQIIRKVVITLGFTDGDNLIGLLRWMQINGNRYTFGN